MTIKFNKPITAAEFAEKVKVVTSKNVTKVSTSSSGSGVNVWIDVAQSSEDVAVTIYNGIFSEATDTFTFSRINYAYDDVVTVQSITLS